MEEQEEMRRVGVREFREALAEYLTSEEPIAITRHGETVGFYIPKPRRPSAEDITALKDAVTRVQATLGEYGVSADEVIREFNERRHSAHKINGR